jgi:arylsulfatase A-like enzyme
MDWFDNTLFVITADHTAEGYEYPFYRSKVGMYAVPIIFYKHDSNLKGRIDYTVQHIGIFPSILDYLNYDGDFITFGNSVFDTTQKRYAVNFISDVYQIISDGYSLQFDGEKSIALYNYQTDSTLSNNLIDIDTEIRNRLEKQLKAIIQTYNYSLIYDKLAVENFKY